MSNPKTIGIVSDIHGNLVALETALEFLANKGVNEIICCGDVVGYGPWPNECIELIQARTACCVLGNHDAVPIGVIDASFFGGNAGIAIRWTQEQLSQHALIFLQSRPQHETLDQLFVTHGSPRDPLWEYLIDRRVAYNNFHHFEQSVGFFGHSHVPTLFAFNQGDVTGGFIYGSQTIALDSKERYLINPGSVGQPRDGDWRLSLAIFAQDEGQAQVSFHRLPYDVEKVQAQMQAANLPPALYNRLSAGR